MDNTATTTAAKTAARGPALRNVPAAAATAVLALVWLAVLVVVLAVLAVAPVHAARGVPQHAQGHVREAVRDALVGVVVLVPVVAVATVAIAGNRLNQNHVIITGEG